MQVEDYKAFVTLKDLLYAAGQDETLDKDTKRMRDELIARLYTIRNPQTVVGAMKSAGYDVKIGDK